MGQSFPQSGFPPPLPLAATTPSGTVVSHDAAPMHGGDFDAVLASYQTKASSGGGLEFLRWPEPSNGDLPTPTGQFRHIQQRLRELGATYSLLETWGDQGQLYRFYCRMAMAGGSQLTRYFEATDADPLSAMATVLEQVETWRRSGQP
jgi:hypothetical protein